jgi:hypothetical protein
MTPLSDRAALRQLHRVARWFELVEDGAKHLEDAGKAIGASDVDVAPIVESARTVADALALQVEGQLSDRLAGRDGVPYAGTLDAITDALERRAYPITHAR